MSTLFTYSAGQDAKRSIPSQPHTGGGVESGKDNSQTTEQINKLVFNTSEVSSTSTSQNSFTEISIPTPSPEVLIQLASELEDKLPVIRENLKQAAKGIDVQMSMADQALSITQPNIQAFTEGSSRAEIASNYVQNYETKNSAVFNMFVKLITAPSEIIRNINYEGWFIGLATYNWLRDGNQFTLYDLCYSWGLAGFVEKKGYFPEEVVESLNPS